MVFNLVSQYLMIILTATLASIGTAGVPGAGMIMLSMVLQTVGLPLTVSFLSPAWTGSLT